MKIRSTLSLRLASSVLSVAMIASMLLGAFAGIAAFPKMAAAQDETGLVDDTTYVSPQFGYTVTWDDPWSTRARNVTSNAGGFDALTLRNGSTSLRITGRAAGDDVATVLDDAIALETNNASDATVDEQDATANPAMATLTVNANTVQIEVHEDESAGAIIVVVLTARTASFDEALADAQDAVQIDDSPILVGEPLGSGATSGSKSTTTDETVTPEETATEDSTDSGSKAIATEEDATETPDATATEESSSDAVTDTAPETSGIDGTTYTSPNFGYTFEWDDSDWTVTPDGEVSQTDPVFDSLYLEGENGNLYINAYDGYDGDPATCLQGESDYYENDDAGVSDWTMANNADGDPLTKEDDSAAWGVFNLTYQNPDDESAKAVKLTDYIECRTLVPGKSILIIFASATRSGYNDHIDLVQAVVDTIEIPEATPETPTKEATKKPTREATEEATETVAVTEEATESPATDVTPDATRSTSTGEVDGLDGSVFTSPSFDFVFTIPDEFSLQDAQVNPGDESLTLTNGVSVITVHASDNADYTGSLTSCVEAVATDAGADRDRFRLDRTADGSAFQGSDDRTAYANYTFTGSDGGKYAFFIECRAITDGESALIVTQVVPYEQYTTERAARREIENSIELP